MIRYDCDIAELAASITAIKPNWLAQADKATRAVVKAKAFKGAGIWSDVKEVFMDLQHNKCVYCERQFENKNYGKIEWDVEHYRPKSSVKAWPDPGRHPHLAYPFFTGAPADIGYYWLAFDPSNYAASCKVCNSTFKSNYFPVAKPRGAATADPAALREEDPYLCYPLGVLDDDPEELLTFVATTATPKYPGSARGDRGQVIIDFFELNKRDELHTGRAQMITLLGGALEKLADGTATAADHTVANFMQAPGIPHANCVRAFARLWQADRAMARRTYDLCRLHAVGAAGIPTP